MKAPMTNQQIFDKVWTHLNKQGKAAKDGEGNCAYRGEGGTMCAVGCLIPDEFYDEGMEKTSIVTLRASPHPDQKEKYDRLGAALENSGLREESWLLLEELQTAHDVLLDGEHINAPFTAWKEDMRRIAARHMLTVPGTDLFTNEGSQA